MFTLRDGGGDVDGHTFHGMGTSHLDDDAGAAVA
jgi:hypothetical protein